MKRVLAVLCTFIVFALAPAASAGPAGWYVTQHFYTGYVKFVGSFVAPTSWGSCQDYSSYDGSCLFTDFPNADVTFRLYRKTSHGWNLALSRRDEVFIVDDTSISQWTFNLFNFEYPLSAIQCPGTPTQYFKWVATLVNPIGGANESDANTFVYYCRR